MNTDYPIAATMLNALGIAPERVESISYSNDHLVVGLRPALTWQPPFEMTRVLDLGSTPVPPPNPDCPLCSGDLAYA